MLWIKALHIFFVVAWFAGLFYLPRLFVYHADTRDAPGHARFCLMERRLFALTTVGGVGAVVFGAWLTAGWWWPLPAWLQAKLVLVAVLIGYQAACWRHLRAFAAGRNTRSASWFRAFNEVPTLILLGAVLLAVVKP